MVGHQHVGIKPTLARAFGLLQGGSIEAVLVLGEEDRLAIVATLDDMMRIGRDSHTGATGHRQLLTRLRGSERLQIGGLRVKKMFSDPNGIKLSPNTLLYQNVTGFTPWFCVERIGFRSAF